MTVQYYKMQIDIQNTNYVHNGKTFIRMFIVGTYIIHYIVLNYKNVGVLYQLKLHESYTQSIIFSKINIRTSCYIILIPSR